VFATPWCNGVWLRNYMLVVVKAGDAVQCGVSTGEASDAVGAMALCAA
jgi:hypothetical protein